jgi:hypothetical protein
MVWSASHRLAPWQSRRHARINRLPTAVGPTAQWLTMMMKRRITSERAEYDQSMSLLSAEYLQGDASFKVSSVFALCHSISTLSQFYHVRVPFDYDSLYACTIYSAAQDYGWGGRSGYNNYENGRHYGRGEETFGIVPLSSDVCDTYQIEQCKSGTLV